MFDSRPSRAIAFWVIATLAFTANVVVAATTVRLTTAGHLTSSEYRVGLAASVFDLGSLAAILLAVGIRRLHAQPRTTIALACAIVVCLVAAVLSIILFALHLNSPSAKASVGLLKAGLAFWAVLLCSETVLYAYLAWPQSGRAETLEAADDSELGSSPARSAKAKSIHLAFVRSSPPRMTRTTSDFYDGDAPLPSPLFRSSWRNSMDQVIRPMTSRTRLIRRSFMSSDARSSHSVRPPSTDTTRQYDGFEFWDTSTVEANTDDLVPPMPPLSRKESRTRLEPIPGSRPVSPAKPLDGPFLESTLPEHLQLPESPLHSPSIAETSSIHEYPLNRRPSTTQAHIHPLFRPESPFPPPLPTPGTVITASPLAGQVVSPEHAFNWTVHSSQTWRPGSSTPGSPTASRSGSVRSLALQSAGLSSPDALPKSPLAGSADSLPG
ncbi:hypothetical protein LTR78_009198 [Recurvomyces mirabilis]|uniref:Uncharacterized protein n=1 Tax=Recurvomyces mirabilis TaxID=574656 RepID=A0AAE0TNQ8_9PEZI|nr:hypothetical protein LTR78_009198 [Recurvomyces mirabilis]KAK5155642.1 hypothetical protein LTS14_005903 [Recurvomyces mirabilis]